MSLIQLDAPPSYIHVYASTCTCLYVYIKRRYSSIKLALTLFSLALYPRNVKLFTADMTQSVGPAVQIWAKSALCVLGQRTKRDL